jgi:dihydrofolate reductase
MKLAEELADTILRTRCFQAIAAVASNGTIGLNNKIPWHIAEELSFFRRMTLGKTVLFGRKTFESIGKALPDRKNIVLSRSAMKIQGVTVAGSVEELLPIEDDIWVCGGGNVYQLLLPACRELYISTIKKNYPGDTTFPEYESTFVAKKILLDSEKFYVTLFVNKNYHADTEEGPILL